MICKADGTYEIEKSDIDKINKWVYKLLSTRATSGTTTFDLNAFVKYVYSVSLEKTQDAQKALVIARQVPMSVDISISADDNLRQSLSKLQGYSTDAVKDLKSAFIASMSAVSDLVNTDPTKKDLANTLAATANAELLQPVTPTIQAGALETGREIVSDLPYTPLSTTGNEDIPGREWYYGFIKNISNQDLGLSNTGTASYFGVKGGIRIAMVLGSQIPVDQLYLDVQNQTNIEEIKKNQLFTVVTDNAGNFIYFNENYEVTDAENGKLVYFPTRTIPSMKVVDGRKVFNLGEQSDRTVQSIEDKVRRIMADAPLLKEKDAREQVEVEFQGAYGLLSDISDHLQNNPSDKVLLNLTGINKGTLRYDQDVVTPLSSIKNLGALNLRIRTTGVSSEGTKQEFETRRYLSIDGVSDKIGFSMNSFSTAMASKVADLLVNDVYTEDGTRLSTDDKYKMIRTFVALGTEGLTIVTANNEIKIAGNTIDLSDKAAAKAAIVEFLTRTIKVKDSKGKEIEIKNQLRFDGKTYEAANGVIDDFTITPASDGTYTVASNLVDYKTWLKDNIYIKIQLDSNGNVTQVNGYFEFNASPETRKTIATRQVEQMAAPKKGEDLSLSGLTAPTVEDKENALAKIRERAKGRNNKPLFSMRHDSLAANKAQIKRGKKWFDTTEIKFKDADGKVVTKKLSEIVPYEVMFNVINSNGDIRATWTRNGITLFNGSDYTDLYHEAWHGFTQLFLTADQKTALYNEVKSLKEDIKYYDHKAGEWKTMNSKDLDFSDRNHIIYAEEYLADKFRKYSMDRSAPSAKVKSIFRKIWDAIKALFSRSTKESAANPYNNTLINQAFDQLYTGNLVDYTFDQANIQFGQLNYGITAIDKDVNGIEGLSIEDSLAISEGINHYIAEYIDMAVAGKVYDDGENPAYSSLILTDSEYKKDALAYAKDMLETQRDKLLAEYATKVSYEKQIAERQIKTLTFAIDQFGDLDDLRNNKKGTLAFFNKKTGYLDLTTYKTDDNTDDATEEDDDDSGRPTKSKDRTGMYAGNGTELSGLDRMDSVLKFVFSNITEIGPDGIKRNQMGLPVMVSSKTIFNMVSSLTENLNDRKEMYLAIWNKSEEKERNGDPTPMAQMLKQFLSKVGEPKDAASGIAQLFWNKVFHGLRTDRLTSIQVNINKTKYGHEVIVGETDSSDKAILRGWQDAFVFDNKSDYLILDPKTNEKYLDLKALNAKYGNIGKGQPIESIDEINPYQFFKDFGIVITPTNKNLRAIREQDIIKTLLRYRLAPLMRIPDLKVTSYNSLFMENHPFINSKGEKSALPEQGGVMNKLLALESKANPKYSDYMRLFGTDARSERSNPSGPGNTLIALNKANNFKDIIARPELSQYNPKKNPAVKTSVIFTKMFPGLGARDQRYSLDYQAMLGTQYIDKRAGIDTLVTSLASSESDEQVAYLRDFFSFSLHGAAEAFKHADKNMAYIIQLLGPQMFYIPIADFAKGAGEGNAGRQAANTIITRYIASELERIKKVLASKELTSGEKASDIILYTDAEATVKDEDGLIREVKYKTLADVGAEFTVFDDILSDDLKARLINDKSIQTVEDFLKLLAGDKALEQSIHRELNNYFAKLVKEDRDQLESFEFFKGANKAKSLSTIKNRSFKNSSLSTDQIFEASLLHYVYASFIHKTEMSTLFYGDPVMFQHDKDEHMKRIPTFFATGKIPVFDDTMENWLLSSAGGYYKSEFFKNSGLTQPTSNQLVTRQLNTAILEDAIESISKEAFDQMVKAYIKNNPGSTEAEAKAKYKSYRNMKSADAQGWISFDAYRALEIRLDNWSPAKEVVYQEVLKGEISDPEILETFFPVKKMQYAGPMGTENFAANAVHKYSLMPLIPTIIKDTELEKLHNKMVSQNIAYSVMHSGSKVASIGNGNKLSKFYTEPNGNRTLAFTAPDYQFSSSVIYLDYFKEQLVTHDTAKGKVKFPTQKRALVTSGLDEFGVPTDFEVGSTDDQRLAAWNALTDEKARLKASKAYTLKRNYQKAFKELFDTAKDKLKMELGYKDPKSTSKTGGLNLEKLMAFVEEQLLNRETLSEYELDFLQMSPSGQLVYPQDFGSDPSQIEKLISSLVNKRITDQMSRGESFIQVSSVGFRKADLAADSSLLFYRIGPDGKTLPMQVKIPLIGDFKNLLNHVDNDGKKIGTIARLNELIKDEKWMKENREMLTMGGDRIPIQGHNSMEVMEVAEFFDPAGGNMMVLPLEIVAKTGGDFDIDKLICLIPVIKNNMGVVELSKPAKTRKVLKTIVKEKSDLHAELKALRKQYIKEELTPEFREEINKLEDEQRAAQEEFNQNYINDYYIGGSLDKYMNRINSAQQTIDAIYDQLFEDRKEVFQGEFDQYIDEAQPILNKLRELNRQEDTFSPDAYQNNLMQAMNELLLRGDNFTNLTLPNDTDTYTAKGGIVDEFTSVNRPYQRSNNKTNNRRKKMSPTRIMENRYNNGKAFAMSAGKSGVSLGAKTNKIFIKYKEVGLYFEPTYTAIKGNKQYPIKQRLLVDHKTVLVNGKRAISMGHGKDVNGKDISDQISQLMNGYLDVAKEDWVFDINAVKELEPEFLLLLQAGVGPRMATALISQPLVKKYVEAIRKRSNAFSLAVSDKETSLSFAKYEALLEILDKNMPDIFNYADAPVNQETGNIITPSNERLLFDAQRFLGNRGNFNINDLIANAKRGADAEVTGFDIEAFAHFMEIMDLTKGDKELKQSIDIDTKKQLTASDATKKINALKDLSGRFPKSKIKSLLDDTYLSNFKTQDLLLEAISKVLPLRGLKSVNDFLYELGKNKKFDDQKARENYEKNFIADFPSYIAANARPRVTSNDASYRGVEIQQTVPINKQALLKFGAIFMDGALQVDQTQIDIDFDNRAYTKDGYGDGLLAKLPPTVFSEYDKNKKTARNLYRAFVFEREIAREAYPYTEIEGEAEFQLYQVMRMNTPGGAKLSLVDQYEEFIRNKALYNAGIDAGRFMSMPSMGIFSMYDTFSAILNQANVQGVNLKEQFPVLESLRQTEVEGKKFNFITLARKVKDVDDRTSFTAQLLSLMNPNVRKVGNEGFNFAISSFFAKFPEMAFAQAGNNSASGLYIGSIIDAKSIAVAQADNLNEYIEALKDPETAKNILEDYARKFEAKAPYKNKAAYFNYNSNKDITDYIPEALPEDALSIAESEVKKEPHWKKDEAMANASTKAIAKATQPKDVTYRSSTKAYLEALGGASTDFTSSDSVWIFGAGAWSATAKNINEDFENYYIPMINKALESGVTTFNIGTASGIDTMATDYLKSKGFTVESQGEWNKLTGEPVTAVETARTIYSKLGNKTQSENVEIAGMGNLSDVPYDSKTFWSDVVPEAKAQFGDQIIVAYRGNRKKSFLDNYKDSGTGVTIGNPFDWQVETGTRDEKGIKSTKRFIHWMITGDNMGVKEATEEYRQAIINDIKNGKLKNRPVIYYQEKGYATHATAIDYLVNKYDWDAQAPVTVKPGVEISSTSKGLAAALTNPTELAKSKGNLTQSYPVYFQWLNENGEAEDNEFKDVEQAYQELKDSSESKTKPSKENSSNYRLMVDLIEAKLNQYPRLATEITKQGGSAWILSSTHQPTTKNTVWETGGQNWFIEALNDAYLLAVPTAVRAQVAVKPTEQAAPGLILDIRGPKELVDYDEGTLIPVAKVYKQTQFITKNGEGVEIAYTLPERFAKQIMDENPNNVFVFDWFRPHSTGKENTAARNNTRQAWRVGLATGQSFGITTRTFEGKTPTDVQFESVKEVIDEQIEQLVQLRDSGKIITFPSDGIGQHFKGAGADQIFVYLSKKLLENFGYRNPAFDNISLVLGPLEVTGTDYTQDFYKKMADAESGEKAQTVTDNEVREHIKTCKIK